jgi:thiol-disulfide isomerase/thioredoxin
MKVRAQRSLLVVSCLGVALLHVPAVSAQNARGGAQATNRRVAQPAASPSPKSNPNQIQQPSPNLNPGQNSTRTPTQKPAPNTKPQTPLTYAMPNTTDVAQLGAYLSQLLDYKPSTPEQAQEYELKGPALMNAVAQRITQLEKDKSHPVHRFAAKYLLAMKLVTLDKTTGQEKVALYQEIQANLTRPDVDADDIDIAIAFADGLQTVGDLRLAGQAYAGFGKTLSRSKEPLIVELSKSMEATSRRLQLLGKPIRVAGTPVDGRPFNWEAYRGKVVLIDFWATWCGPCLAELPNVEKLRAQYGEQGFEIVSISMDEEREKLDEFLAKKPLPWVVLHDEGGKNPTAEYYGVNAVPTAILVDRSGNVVSLMARGKNLEESLASLMGKTASRQR